MDERIATLWLVVTILSLVSSVLAAAATLSLAYANAKSAERTLHMLTNEVSTLEQIMKDCYEMLQGAAEMDSARHSYDMCLQRYYDLMKTLEKLWEQIRDTSMGSSFNRTMSWKRDGETLMVKYNSFRDAVLLLRDLSAEVYSTIVPMFTALAALVSDEEDNENDEGIDSDTEQEHGHTLQGNASDLIVRARRKKERRIEMLDLIQSGFNRSIWIIIDVDADEGQQRSKEIIFRTKWDSGSEENAVSLRALRSEGMRMDLVQTIPEASRVMFTWLDGQFSYTPDSMVTLHWFTKKDMKRRRDKFFIVPDDAPFDVLIKQSELGKEIEQAMLIAMGRYKKKDEKTKEAAEHAKKIREAREQVERRMADTEASRNHSIIRRMTGLGSVQSNRSTTSPPDA